MTLDQRMSHVWAAVLALNYKADEPAEIVRRKEQSAAALRAWTLETVEKQEQAP